MTCDNGLVSQPFANRLPETNLSIQPYNNNLDTTYSTQYVNWWGNDPDGEVLGYFYQWSYFAEEYPDSFIWTTSEADTFTLPIRQTSDNFWFKIKAVDNTAKWNYEQPTKSNIDNEYFSDIGSENRILDSVDVILSEGYINGIQTQIGSELYTLRGDEFYNLAPTDTIGAVDKTPAYADFPIKNSAPTVSFVYGSNPIDTIKVETFTTRTFNWIGYDPDGNESLKGFYYTIYPKDTKPPETLEKFSDGIINGKLDGKRRSVTLRNIPEGNWVFYLVAEDIAGQLSEIIQFPRGDGTWTVKKPNQNGILFIDDYGLVTAGDEIYPDALNKILGVNNYSVWHIEERIPYSKIDIEETLNFFNYIIYYAEGQSHLSNLSNEILSYILTNSKDHHILISCINAIDNNDSLYSFLSSESIDLVKRRYRFDPEDDYRIGPGTTIFSRDTNYVNLKVTPGKIVSNPDGLILGSDADTLYQLPSSNRGEWEGEPVIGLKYPHDYPAKLVFLSFTLHNTNGSNNVIEVIREFLGK